MNKQSILGSALFVSAALAGCDTGPPKQAGTCPEGTVLKGSDCVPSESAREAREEATMSGSSGSSSSSSSSSGTGSEAPSSSTTGAKAPYDKEEVDIKLKNAAERVKKNCGSATDNDGKASGPWGKTKVSVTLGRNGHTQNITVPPPFDGKPTGNCAIKAF